MTCFWPIHSDPSSPNLLTLQASVLSRRIHACNHGLAERGLHETPDDCLLQSELPSALHFQSTLSSDNLLVLFFLLFVSLRKACTSPRMRSTFFVASTEAAGHCSNVKKASCHLRDSGVCLNTSRLRKHNRGHVSSFSSRATCWLLCFEKTVEALFHRKVAAVTS